MKNTILGLKDCLCLKSDKLPNLGLRDRLRASTASFTIPSSIRTPTVNLINFCSIWWGGKIDCFFGIVCGQLASQMTDVLYSSFTNCILYPTSVLPNGFRFTKWSRYLEKSRYCLTFFLLWRPKSMWEDNTHKCIILCLLIGVKGLKGCSLLREGEILIWKTASKGELSKDLHELTKCLASYPCENIKPIQRTCWFPIINCVTHWQSFSVGFLVTETTKSSSLTHLMHFHESCILDIGCCIWFLGRKM